MRELKPYVKKHPSLVITENGAKWVLLSEFQAIEEVETALYSALERLERNAQCIFAKVPVRDWEETLAEANAALDKARNRW